MKRVAHVAAAAALALALAACNAFQPPEPPPPKRAPTVIYVCNTFICHFWLAKPPKHLDAD